jgi:hypothetical protein
MDKTLFWQNFALDEWPAKFRSFSHTWNHTEQLGGKGCVSTADVSHHSKSTGKNSNFN